MSILRKRRRRYFPHVIIARGLFGLLLVASGVLHATTFFDLAPGLDVGGGCCGTGTARDCQARALGHRGGLCAARRSARQRRWRESAVPAGGCEALEL